MQRFGRDPEIAGILIDEARRVGLDVVGISIHPPLAGTPAEHAAEISELVDGFDPDLPVWVSHLDAAAYGSLPTSHEFRLRLGTLLWHGDKSTLHLNADVLDVREVQAGAHVGYRLGPVPTDGHLVMVGAGTAHGVTANASLGGSEAVSPFHFDRTRLSLHEPPHMHTSMCFVPTGTPTPDVGDRVDVQRPLTMTMVDQFEWL